MDLNSYIPMENHRFAIEKMRPFLLFFKHRADPPVIKDKKVIIHYRCQQLSSFYGSSLAMDQLLYKK